MDRGWRGALRLVASVPVFGLKVTVRSRMVFLRTLSLEISMQRKTHRLENLSIHWAVLYRKVVPKDSQVIQFARGGDIKSLMRMFEAGNACCTDMTPNGTSLLHFRKFYSFLAETATHAIQITARESHREMVNCLLECGADPNAIDDDGE